MLPLSGVGVLRPAADDLGVADVLREMGRKSKKSKAASGKGPTKVAKAEVDKAKPVPTTEPIQTVTPRNAKEAAVSAVRQFYDKLIQLPLDEKAPSFYSHYLITSSTLERMGKSCHVRAEKNGFILQDVLETVQQKPDLLVVFCNLLQEIYIAAELAQLIKDKYDEEVVNLKETVTHNTTSAKTGPDVYEVFRRWQCFCLLVTIGIVVLCLAPQYITEKTTEVQMRVPPIPSAFTGREQEVKRIVDLVGARDVRIVSITGGPAYGKSSLAIVSSHRLIGLGIPVYYVSLSEADTMETFIMAFMHSTAVKKTEDVYDKNDYLDWVSSLETNTTIFLDNADHLTLDEHLRNKFLLLLKDTIATSRYVHLVVTTRYRFKIADDFQEVHVQPLESSEAIMLLKGILLAAKDEDENGIVDFEVIVNKTGGIPLAIKVVGRLLISKALSGVELIEELSTNPLNTLSKESFTPDEQLRRCFDLSFKYLKPREQQCFHYTSMFPGSFDRKARDAIITATTGDENCLEHLVDRSLVEYSNVASRYTMHSLLRAFSRDSMKEKYQERKYFRLFATHYTSVLSGCIKEAQSGGNVSFLYFVFYADHHNFLHILNLYVNGTISSLVPQADMLAFALDSFDVMQPRFPPDTLIKWWSKILNNTCNTIGSERTSPDLFVPQLLQLGMKFGQLLLHYNYILLARSILHLTDQCVWAIMLPWTDQCAHPHEGQYNAMLQVLADVYERNEEIQQALNLRTHIYSCMNLESWNAADTTLPSGACSDGIDYLKQNVKDSGDFHSALLLFDALLRCNMPETTTSVEIAQLENRFHEHHVLTQQTGIQDMISVAKRCHMIGDHKKEVQWLTLAAESTEDNFISFYLHFRLARLFWQNLNEHKKAIKHGKAAYHQALQLIDDIEYLGHDLAFKAAIRLADILHQINGSHMDAAQYFQEALDRLPFINADPHYVYDYQGFIVAHLLSISSHNDGEHLFQHFGQWAKLGLAETAHEIQIMLGLENRRIFARSRSLVMVHDSLDNIFDDGGTTRKVLNTFLNHLNNVTVRYEPAIVMCAFLFISFGLGWCIVLLIPFFCNQIRNIIVKYFVRLLLHWAHFFSWHKCTLWLTQLAHSISNSAPVHLCSLSFGTVISLVVCVLISLWLYLSMLHNAFVHSPMFGYHNRTMGLSDDQLYQWFF